MRVRLKLKPGQRGTKHLTRQYGDRLVCVRYRYDENSRKRFTTVELVVAEDFWQPPAVKPDPIVRIKVAFNEVDLRQKVLTAGGKWSKSTKSWKVPFNVVHKLGLEKRIILDEDKKQHSGSI
jgi:hypothetical protein